MRVSSFSSAGFLAIVSLALLIEPQYARANIYTFTQINLPDSSAHSINDSGQIVGEYQYANANGTAFLLSGTTLTQFVAGSRYTFPEGINNAGEVVGNYGITSPSNLDFLYNGGIVTTLTPPSAIAFNYVFNINNNGDIVGFGGSTPSGVVSDASGFLWSGSSAYTFMYPGSVSTYAFGVNDSDAIVGAWENSQSQVSGFLLSSTGTFTNINVPGSAYTQPQDINNLGVIVGEDGANGFVYSNGGFTALDYPGSIQTELLGINNNGDIVGQYENTSGDYYGFLATPTVTPEPSLLPVVAPMIIALAWCRFRRKATKTGQCESR